MTVRTMLIAGAAVLGLSACSDNQASPLLFGQGITVGISAGPSAANPNTPEITVGVKQLDMAVVPTVVPKDVPLSKKKDGSEGPRQITAHAADQVGPNGDVVSGEQDALSTFGSFSTDTTVGGVKLGIFFATGIAAQNLSAGFTCAVSNDPNICRKTAQEMGMDSGNPTPAGN